MRAIDVLLRLRRVVVVFLLCTAIAAPATAQTWRGVAPPDNSGPLRDAAAAAASDVVQAGGHRSDPLWNGALIGAGVAVASGLFLCTRTEPWRNCRDDVGPMLRIGAIGAGVGIAIDALIRRRAPQSGQSTAAQLYAAPVVTKQVRGLQLALSF